MVHETLRDSTAVTAFRALVSDLTDLARNEARLARAELTQKLSGKVRAGIWLAAGGVLGLVAVLLLVQALVHGIARLGIGLHWSYLIVAVVFALAAVAAFFYGPSQAKEPLTPSRTLKRVQADIRAVQES